MELELQKYDDVDEVIVRYETPKNAVWEIVFDYSGKLSVFITNEEKEKFLTALASGANYVEIRGNVLSKNFLLIRYSEDMVVEEMAKEFWNNRINSTKSMVNQYEEHFKKVQKERNSDETKA